ncbi:MAG: NUMOD3 domain-containing DNA-binding protein [Candidatus Omnitrophica bacterium]|jgi:hypothetical protein|nr:NUMOD3 domain-containing DNA-binding protein [Candidatus Omnitrophota bacterium]
MEEKINIIRDGKGRFVKGMPSPKGMTGKKHSDEWKNIMKEKMKGRKLSDEWKYKIGKSNSVALKGKKQSKETIENRTKSLKEAYSSGRRIHHFKGKHFSEEHRKKISDGNKGKKMSKEFCEKKSIRLKELYKDKTKHPCYGRKLSEETKRKIGLSNAIKMKGYWKKNKPTEKQIEFRNKRKEEIKNSRCSKCGTIISKNKIHNCTEIIEKNRLSHIGIKYSNEHNLNISKSNKGKHKRIKAFDERKKISASNQKISLQDWCGFKSDESKRLRKTSMWKIWREAVFLRDNFTCQNKNCKYCNNKIGVELHPHHIKPFALYPELRFVISNGITYCRNYHLKSNLHRKMQVGD